ncbi:MAG TPA: AAA family ATPase [Bryobacteraceae bacterium]|nr:AAA family ATPase [Bryobacteraceae bacterium]
MSTISIASEPPSITGASVVLIAPDSVKRQVLARELAGLNVRLARQCSDYPDRTLLEELHNLDCDVFIVDIGADIERALGLIEVLANGREQATVMACSASGEPGLLLRAMRAGAREFLAEPVPPAVLAEALARALARKKSQNKKTAAKILAFAGAKGGAGTTMLATNFGIVLAQQDGGRVVVVDLDIQLGEVAMNLGLTPQFSVLDAVQNVDRLDSDFVQSLLCRHNSGLLVLASPEQYASFTKLSGGLERLFEILRESFDFVVVDGGSLAGSVENILLNLADTLYLVTERSIPSLRNARRMLTFLAGRERKPRLEVILNRFNSREAEIDEASAAKALGRPVDWKIPNDFPAVRTAENTGIPVALKDSPISQVLRQMATTACGRIPRPEKKSKSLLSFFQ